MVQYDTTLMFGSAYSFASASNWSSGTPLIWAVFSSVYSATKALYSSKLIGSEASEPGFFAFFSSGCVGRKP
ncbi:hypothetical protein D3C87_2121000 [compost metagenome]